MKKLFVLFLLLSGCAHKPPMFREGDCVSMIVAWEPKKMIYETFRFKIGKISTQYNWYYIQPLADGELITYKYKKQYMFILPRRNLETWSYGLERSWPNNPRLDKVGCNREREQNERNQ